MSKYDLSVIIPARQEEFLLPTILDVLKNRRARTEVICVADGEWPTEPIPSLPDVTLIHHPVSIGQRAACNEAIGVSRAKFVMKLDAHCRVGKGFDEILMRDCEYNWTVVPRLFNLHAFDWKCRACGNQTYQGPQPSTCTTCGKTEGFKKVLVWVPRDGEHWACTSCWKYFRSKQKPEACPECKSTKGFRSAGRRVTDSMRFDQDLHFQYWREFNKRPEGKGEITDTMSLLGACWFLHRERYWELGGLDESHGSWGQMGTEIACATWLSGGRLVCNSRTWYSHLFRTGSGFGFPYPMSHSQQEAARAHSRKLWLKNSWPGQKYPLSWLIERFAPVPGWSEKDLATLKAAEAKQGRFKTK